MRKYVHRVGRTARAGKEGDAWSLVEEQEVSDPSKDTFSPQVDSHHSRYQVAPFRNIMAKAQHYQKIERVRVKDQLVEPFVPAYQTALERLKAHFATGREQD